MAETARNDGPADEAGDEPIEDVPMYRKRRIIIPAVIIILAAVAFGWYWYVVLREYISSDDAFIEQNRVAVSSKVLGRIARLTVDEGDTVTRGQLIVQLDPSDATAQLAQAEASLNFAEESVKLARVNLSRAKDDYARAEQQFKSGVTTKEQYEHARSALDASQAELGMAISRVGTARAQVGVAQTALDNCTITSPVDGNVAKRWVLQGDVVQPAQPIIAVYDRQQIWVTAHIEETNMGAIAIGAIAAIDVDTYPGRHFRGRVYQIGGSTAAQFSLIPPNNASGNFTKVTQRIPIKLSIQQEDSTHPVILLPGMSVEVKIKVH